MKRLICLLVSLGSLMILLTGCKGTCKYPGCNDEAEKNGYCMTHYFVNEGQKAAGAIQGAAEAIKGFVK